MSLRLKRPSAAMVVAGTALAVAVGGGTAFAASSALPANSVNTKQIVNQAVTYQKLADGQIGVAKLSPYVQQLISGQTPVTSLGGTWVDHSGGGNSAIGASGAKLSGTGTGGYAGISTDVLNGLTPADLSTISYTESYTGGAGVNAEPYFKLQLEDSTGSCDNGNDVLYAPDAQTPSLSYPGETQTYNVTAPYSTVGVDNDAQPSDGNYPTAIHSASNGAGEDVSGQTICLAEIIFDGGSGASGGTATISNVSFAGAGIKPVSYQFGS